MKGKRYTTEDNIRILRTADGYKNIVDITTLCMWVVKETKAAGREPRPEASVRFA